MIASRMRSVYSAFAEYSDLLVTNRWGQRAPGEIDEENWYASFGGRRDGDGSPKSAGTRLGG